jgi:hypothetical protein
MDALRGTVQLRTFGLSLGSGRILPARMVMKKLILASVFGLQFACSSTCSGVCDKLLSCPQLDAGAIGDKECDLDCAVQENAYESDPVLSTAFEVYKDCVMDSSCQELVAGACYQEGLFAF